MPGRAEIGRRNRRRLERVGPDQADLERGQQEGAELALPRHRRHAHPAPGGEVERARQFARHHRPFRPGVDDEAIGSARADRHRHRHAAVARSRARASRARQRRDRPARSAAVWRSARTAAPRIAAATASRRGAIPRINSFCNCEHAAADVRENRSRARQGESDLAIDEIDLDPAEHLERAHAQDQRRLVRAVRTARTAARRRTTARNCRTARRRPQIVDRDIIGIERAAGDRPNVVIGPSTRGLRLASASIALLPTLTHDPVSMMTAIGWPSNDALGHDQLAEPRLGADEDLASRMLLGRRQRHPLAVEIDHHAVPLQRIDPEHPGAPRLAAASDGASIAGAERARRERRHLTVLTVLAPVKSNSRAVTSRAKSNSRARPGVEPERVGELARHHRSLGAGIDDEGVGPLAVDRDRHRHPVGQFVEAERFGRRAAGCVADAGKPASFCG